MGVIGATKSDPIGATKLFSTIVKPWRWIQAARGSQVPAPESTSVDINPRSIDVVIAIGKAETAGAHVRDYVLRIMEV
jgi:hypothetical protein